MIPLYSVSKLIRIVSCRLYFQIIAAYFEDDCADELTNEPVFIEILRKEVLASQPTLSRFWNRMDEDTLKQFDITDQAMRNTVYSVRHPDCMLFDLDSTLLNTYGNQEGEACEEHDCKYAIRFKEHKKLRKLAASEDESLTRVTNDNVVDYAVEYGEFFETLANIRALKHAPLLEQ
jgi:hypothetical protein